MQQKEIMRQGTLYLMQYGESLFTVERITENETLTLSCKENEKEAIADFIRRSKKRTQGGKRCENSRRKMVATL